MSAVSDQSACLAGGEWAHPGFTMGGSSCIAEDVLGDESAGQCQWLSCRRLHAPLQRKALGVAWEHGIFQHLFMSVHMSSHTERESMKADHWQGAFGLLQDMRDTSVQPTLEHSKRILSCSNKKYPSIVVGVV
eukprot:5999771-Amphidinium_carterae.1